MVQLKRHFAAGKTFHLWAKPMLDSFIFLGGTGATLGLILAIFIASRRADHRQVAKLALPFAGLFQINEPIIFGLPCDYESRDVYSFYSYSANPCCYYRNRLLPWDYSAGHKYCTLDDANRVRGIFNTNGSIAALLLALFNLAVATLIYLPFVIISNKAQTEIDKEEK